MQAPASKPKQKPGPKPGTPRTGSEQKLRAVRLDDDRHAYAMAQPGGFGEFIRQLIDEHRTNHKTSE